MTINYYIKGICYEHDILLNQPQYTLESPHEHKSLLERDMLDAYCYIFKGHEIQFGHAFERRYKFGKSLLGYKLLDTSKDFAKLYLSERNYPQDFIQRVDYGKIPDVNNEHKHYAKKCTKEQKPVLLDTKDYAYITIPAQYSLKKYNDLKIQFSKHNDFFRFLLQKLNITLSQSNRNYIQIRSHSIGFGGAYCKFNDFGMESLPEQMDILIACSDSIINCYCNIYPNHINDNLIVNIYLHRGSGYSFPEIELYYSSPTYKGKLNKW